MPVPDDVDRILSSLPTPARFADAAKPCMENAWDQKSDVPLWNLVRKVNNGANLPADLQTIGDCVSHGHARGLDYLQCIQIALGKRDDAYVEGQNSVMSEAVYGMCREEGNGLGMQDGAAGIWAVEALRKGGFIPRTGKLYDGRLAKEWGRTGCPSEVKSLAKKHLLEQYARVSNAQEAINALWNGKPVTVCSNQGFTMTRNQDGICEAQGSWAHCMLFIGAYIVGNELIFCCLQSWGQNVPSGPTVKGMPDNSFGIRTIIADRMLRSGDSYALSAAQGFPAEKINFYV